MGVLKEKQIVLKEELGILEAVLKEKEVCPQAVLEEKQAVLEEVVLMTDVVQT